MIEDHLAKPVHKLKRKIRIFFLCVKVVITTINRKDKQEYVR